MKQTKQEIYVEKVTTAYKVTDKNMVCRNQQYELGKLYEMDDDPIICERGFHACMLLTDCFSYYSFSPENRCFVVEIYGDYVTHPDDSKIAGRKIKLISELTWEDVLRLVNSGNWNSGCKNSGSWNSGDGNSGNGNSGNGNSGSWNSGYKNSGCKNSGDGNSGNRNSGYKNSGDGNSGYKNSGSWNSGDRNSGYKNSGNRNSGYKNSGDGNSGNRNSGKWNSGDWNSGFFNSITPPIMAFNKVTEHDYFSYAQLVPDIDLPISRWIEYDKMTAAEKTANPKAETCGGYLQIMSYKEAWAVAWENLSAADKKKIENLPNFDADVFHDITGIRV